MGKSNEIRFAELAALLRRFGYALDPEQSAEDHFTFRHPDRPLRIILPAYRDNAAVRAVHLAVVRHVLTDGDPAEAREFEAWLDGRVSLDAGEVPVR